MSSVLQYVQQREISTQPLLSKTGVSENITVSRGSESILAQTPLCSRSTYFLRLNPNNTLIAAAHGDRTIAIYSSVTGQMLAACDGHERSPWTMAFHPSDSYCLASGCLGGNIRLWNLECLSAFNTTNAYLTNVIFLKAIRVWKQSGAISSLTFHPIHPILIVAWTQEVVFYDWVSGRTLSTWKFVSEHSRVRWLRLSPDGSFLYTATGNPSDQQTHNLHSKKSEMLPKSQTENDGAKKTHQFLITRYELLQFLIKQSDSWYQNLSICRSCSVRLCKWAGSLSSSFPNTDTKLETGVANTISVAFATAESLQSPTSHLSFILKTLLKPELSQSETISNLNLDPHPAAVAIIEDLPAKEFLISRRTYCKIESPGAFSAAGMCCGGHAYDLVLTHRQLMRYSLCRPCLQSFWRWTSETVDWWTWKKDCQFESQTNVTGQLEKEVLKPITQTTKNEVTNIHQPIKMNNVEFTQNSMALSSLSHLPIGICINCRLNTHQTALISPSKMLKRESHCQQNPVSTSKLSIFNAALNLLRSRLNNATEVTQLTFLASKIVNDQKLSSYLQQILLSSRSKYKKEKLPTLLVNQLQNNSHFHKVILSNDENPKKFRLSDDHRDNDSRFDETLKNNVSNKTYKTNAIESEKSLNVVQQFSNVHTAHQPHYNWTTEASDFGNLLKETSPDWNHHDKAAVICIKHGAKTFQKLQSSQVFDYAQSGAYLINNTNKNANLLKTVPNNSSQTSSLSNNQSHINGQSSNISCMTACCKCGCIVPHTFPVDPKSSLSQAVSTDMVFPDGLTMTHRSSRIRTPASSENLFTSLTSTNSSTNGHNDSSDFNQSSSSSRVDNSSVMSIFHTNNSNSILNSMHQGITNIVAGLLTDMGEHSSANSLNNTTYRICQWQLKLCGPLNNNVCDGKSDFHSSPIKIDTPRQFLPMPANTAVSYNRNTLVIPHVCIFNDSSICISPDGKMLGAFIVSRPNNIPNRLLPTENLLAIYRLEPRHRRGQCLYVRKFANANPVCVDFSPTANMIVVGLATSSRLQNTNNLTNSEFPNHSGVQNNQSNVLQSDDPCEYISRRKLPLLPVARIFKIDKSIDSDRCRFSHILREVKRLPHPRQLALLSSSLVPSVETWHRSLLLVPNALSVNTIVWCSSGGIIYGTTKGIVVMVRPKPMSLIESNTPLHLSQSINDVSDEFEQSTEEKQSHQLAYIISNNYLQLS